MKNPTGIHSHIRGSPSSTSIIFEDDLENNATARAAWTASAATSVKIGLGLSQAASDQGRDLKDNNDFQDFLDELIKKTS